MPFSDIIGQAGPKKKIRTAVAHETIGHAYLFSGDDGIGKHLMALRFAQALSCETPPSSAQPDSCGHCRACQQIAAATHPDLLLIEPEREKANPQIKIDQVRAIERHMIYRPLLSARKICVIDDADRLTISAANALLKTLEDPPDHSLFILVTSQPYRLPATVRSRCLTLRFSSTTSEQCEGMLALRRTMPPDDAKFLSRIAGNRIGIALEADLSLLRQQHDQFLQCCQSDALAHPTAILQQAEALSKSQRTRDDEEEDQSRAQHFSEVLDWLAHGLRDLLLIRLGAAHDLLLHRTHLSLLQRCAEGLDPEDLLNLLESLHTLEQAPYHNLNLQLCLENFLFRFHRIIHRHAA